MSKYVEEKLKRGANFGELPGLEAKPYQELANKVLNEPTKKGTSTGSKELDDVIGGFENGRLYVLSAPTKQGKTTLVQTMMFDMAKQGNGSLFFSYEMGWKEVVGKWMQMDGALESKKPTPLPMFVPLELDRQAGDLQFYWIEELIEKSKKESNIKLAVIDHLHFLLPLKDYQNTSFLIGGIVRELKRIAVRQQIPIILICHVAKIKDDKVPDWTDIRDSSFITQEADVVLMLYRVINKNTARKVSDDSIEAVYRQKAILSVELDRVKGKSEKISLWHDGTKFVPYTIEHEEIERSKGLINDAGKTKAMENVKKIRELGLIN